MVETLSPVIPCSGRKTKPNNRGQPLRNNDGDPSKRRSSVFRTSQNSVDGADTGQTRGRPGADTGQTRGRHGADTGQTRGRPGQTRGRHGADRGRHGADTGQTGADTGSTRRRAMHVPLLSRCELPKTSIITRSQPWLTSPNLLLHQKLLRVSSRATGVPCLLPSPKWQRNGTSTPSKWSANLADRF